MTPVSPWATPSCDHDMEMIEEIVAEYVVAELTDGEIPKYPVHQCTKCGMTRVDLGQGPIVIPKARWESLRVMLDRVGMDDVLRDLGLSDTSVPGPDPRVREVLSKIRKQRPSNP